MGKRLRQLGRKRLGGGGTLLWTFVLLETVRNYDDDDDEDDDDDMYPSMEGHACILWMKHHTLCY